MTDPHQTPLGMCLGCANCVHPKADSLDGQCPAGCVGKKDGIHEAEEKGGIGHGQQ